MIKFFKCKHPAERLAVMKEQSVVIQDEDFEIITYYLHCGKCGEPLQITHARCIGGVSAFLARG